ncbi:ribonuclease P protein subunit p21 isoform X2 [Diprion similis]|uniref:ribonuclease P protein subunit p21 isoform X2 n=1 Tax=Diprion similis TaxID=362088 RepID=UPI001EF7CC1B|nr:ribonuclease P protein subunit p21 isoform X2 [Diprion similis]
MSSNAINVKLCQGKDVLERMNYLYQASHLMAIQSKNPVAASYYGNIMLGCAKKAVLRMSPDVKRTICKRCQLPLIPGDTARVRLVSKPMKLVKWTCLTCGATRKFPTKKGYKLWADQPEALVELFDYTPKQSVDNVTACNRRNNDATKSSSPSVDGNSLCTIENHGNSFPTTEENTVLNVESNLRQDKNVISECTMVQD